MQDDHPGRAYCLIGREMREGLPEKQTKVLSLADVANDTTHEYYQ